MEVPGQPHEPAALLPRKSCRYLINRSLGEFQRRMECFIEGKVSWRCRGLNFGSSAPQPRQYTDWVVPATSDILRTILNCFTTTGTYASKETCILGARVEMGCQENGFYGHEWEWSVKRLDFRGTSGIGVSRDWILRARVGVECQETGFYGHEWELSVKRLDFTGTSAIGVSRDWILGARVGVECQETGFYGHEWDWSVKRLDFTGTNGS